MYIHIFFSNDRLIFMHLKIGGLIFDNFNLEYILINEKKKRFNICCAVFVQKINKNKKDNRALKNKAEKLNRSRILEKITFIFYFKFLRDY